jgi:hypothetical protein
MSLREPYVECFAAMVLGEQERAYVRPTLADLSDDGRRVVLRPVVDNDQLVAD